VKPKRPDPGDRGAKDDIARFRDRGWLCALGGIAVVATAQVIKSAAIWTVLVLVAGILLVVAVQSFRRAEQLRRKGGDS
jgi:hypothetical protein